MFCDFYPKLTIYEINQHKQKLLWRAQFSIGLLQVLWQGWAMQGFIIYNCWFKTIVRNYSEVSFIYKSGFNWFSIFNLLEDDLHLESFNFSYFYWLKVHIEKGIKCPTKNWKGKCLVTDASCDLMAAGGNSGHDYSWGRILAMSSLKS